LPLVAPLGTATVMLPALHDVGLPAVPLNVTVLVPCVAPKPAPVIVTGVPTTPDAGLRLKMLGGGGVTVKFMPLLACPPTVTTTLPLVAAGGTVAVMLVALHAVAVAAVPLKVTVLVPWLAPKLPPVIVTNAAAGPLVGLRPVIVGVAVIEKLTWLLASPKTTT
jgi:hypothetical protein